MSSFFNMPNPPRFWPTECLYIFRQCSLMISMLRQTYAHCPSFNLHFIPSVYTGKPSTASSTYLGILNSPENCAILCYCSISSDTPMACFQASYVAYLLNDLLLASAIPHIDIPYIRLPPTRLNARNGCLPFFFASGAVYIRFDYLVSLC
jgi:hypothetical protein